MTNGKVKRIVGYYSNMFQFPSPPERLSEKEYGIRSTHRNPERCGHIMWMCRRVVELIDEGREKKAHRWLGFIQGWLWAQGLRSLNDLKDESRS